MKIKISTDSTCDLPAELIAAHDIGVQPLYIIRDGEALRDGIDVTPDDLYAYTKETGKLCGTSAVTITDYLGSWKAWLEEYDAIVHVAFSSELSASCNNARLAAMELPGKVWVVDSLNLSTGFGHLVLIGSNCEALYSVYSDFYGIPDSALRVMKRKKLKRLISYLASSDDGSSLLIKNAPEKAHLLIPSAVLACTVAKYFSADELIISGKGVKEGYLRLLMEEING